MVPTENLGSGSQEERKKKQETNELRKKIEIFDQVFAVIQHVDSASDCRGSFLPKD